MVQPWCVQVALRATKVPSAACATRKSPIEVWTRAIPPAAARGDPAPTLSVIALRAVSPVTTGSGLALDSGPAGLVPHPSSIALKAPARAATEVPRHAVAQNSRRVVGLVVVSMCSLPARGTGEATHVPPSA